MPLDELISQRITGILPFNELVIDAEIWREAHTQHKQHRHLHALATHRPGIVFGLEVLVAPDDPAKLVVMPGVAVDSAGRTIIVPKPASFPFDERGPWFLIATFEEVFDQRSEVKIGGGKKYYRLVEGHQITKTKELPTTPYVELARVERSKPDKAIRDPLVPFDPGEDEINILYRPYASPHIFADGGVGELAYAPKTEKQTWKPNRAGILSLLREANTMGFAMNFSGPLVLKNTGKPSDPTLVYMAGGGDFQPLVADQIEGLSRYLENGGILFGEASKGNEAFAKAFDDLVKKLGGRLTPVSKGHPLLTSHHVFSSSPSGAQDSGKLTIDDEKGLVFSSYDYGRAWMGDLSKPDASDARNRIRDSIEFGINLFAYAARRRRMHELMRTI